MGGNKWAYVECIGGDFLYQVEKGKYGEGEGPCRVGTWREWGALGEEWGPWSAAARHRWRWAMVGWCGTNRGGHARGKGPVGGPAKRPVALGRPEMNSVISDLCKNFKRI
jgi:hypothetical protein